MNVVKLNVDDDDDVLNVVFFSIQKCPTFARLVSTKQNKNKKKTVEKKKISENTQNIIIMFIIIIIKY